MVRGKSGRIVLEVDPSVKERLYDALSEEGVTLKEWFLRRAIRYISERTQPSLFDPEYRDKVPPQETGKKPED